MLSKILTAGLLSLCVSGMSITSYAASYGWHRDAHGWWFDNGDGTYIADDAEFIDIDAAGATDNVCQLFLFDERGYLITDQVIREAGEIFYIDSNGYIYDSAHELIKLNLNEEMGGNKPGWNRDGYGWWYLESNGTYPTDCIYYIQNPDMPSVYCAFKFDKYGYLVTNQEVRGSGKVYHADENGYLYDAAGVIQCICSH